MAKHNSIEELFTATANAIREKENSSAKIIADNFPDRISALSIGGSAGTDASDATAVASDIVSGKTAYGASGKITGTMPSVSGKTIVPTTSSRTAISFGSYAAGTITVAGSSNLKSQNIKSGVNLFGITGTYKLASGTFVGNGTDRVILTPGLSNIQHFIIMHNDENPFWSNLNAAVVSSSQKFLVFCYYNSDLNTASIFATQVKDASTGNWSWLWLNKSSFNFESSGDEIKVDFNNRCYFASGITYAWAAW